MLGQREAPAPDVVTQPAEDPASSSLRAEPDANAQRDAESGMSLTLHLAAPDKQALAHIVINRNQPKGPVLRVYTHHPSCS